MSSDRSERVQRVAMEERARVQRRGELYGQSLDDDEEDTPSTESRPMTDAEVLAAGPGKGQPGDPWQVADGATWIPRNADLTIDSAPDVKRYLDVRRQDMLGKEETTPEQWTAFIVTHGVYDRSARILFLCFYSGHQGGHPLFPMPTKDTRIPFKGETQYIVNSVPAEVLESVRVHCWTKFYEGDDSTRYFYTSVARFLEEAISGADIKRKLTLKQKKDIQAVVREYQNGGKSDLEWGDLFLRHCTTSETTDLWGLRIGEADAHTLVGTERIFQQAERAIRFQRQPTTGEAQFLVQTMKSEDVTRTRRGVESINNEVNNWIRAYSKTSTATLEQAMRILTLNSELRSVSRLNAFFSRLLNPVGHTNHLLESSNFGTWAHREQGLSAEVVKRIAYLADGSVPTNSRTSTAMLQRIETTRSIINTTLKQLADHGRLDTSDGRRRTREQLHAMADAVREAAGEMGDEEERPTKKKTHQ